MKKVLIALLVAGFVTGCGTSSNVKLFESGKLSPAELRDELDRFEYLFVNSITQMSKQFKTDDPTRRAKREDLQNRTRIIEALHAMMATDDPVVAYVDTWGLIVRLRLMVEGPQGEELYGENQIKAVAFIQLTDKEIERIGKLFINEKLFEKTRSSIETFASEHPVTGTFSNLIVYATQQEMDEKEDGGVLAATLRIPMAPIRALEGVDKTGDAIVKVRDSVDRFTGVAQQLPESARWQMSILMDDFEESKMTQSFLTSLKQFSESTEKMAEVLDTLPDDLRDELVTVLQESDETQQQLQTTIKATEQAAAQIEKTLNELQSTSVSIDNTAAQATLAANAWREASDSIQDLVALFTPQTPPSPDAPPSFGMRDFDTMLLNAGKTADKIANTIAHLQETINAGKDSEVEKKVRSLIDHATLRLFQLVLVIFALMLVFTVLRRKLTKI